MEKREIHSHRKYISWNQRLGNLCSKTAFTKFLSRMCESKFPWFPHCVYKCPKLTFYYTVWKFYDFSITLILREINFGDSRSTYENSHFKTFRGSEIVFLTFALFEGCYWPKQQNQSPWKAKKAVLELLYPPKLISQKIWVTEKILKFVHCVLQRRFWTFMHTVWKLLKFTLTHS